MPEQDVIYVWADRIPGSGGLLVLRIETWRESTGDHPPEKISMLVLDTPIGAKLASLVRKQFDSLDKLHEQLALAAPGKGVVLRLNI